MFLFNKKKPKNHEDRRDGMSPYIILLHYTGMETMEAARDRLSDPESKVSAHYLVDEDGTVMNLVPEEKRAWHAGLSYWRGETDINSASIGVEIVNPGHEFGYRPFPKDQMMAVRDLCLEIQTRHKIKYVLGHSDVAPDRKIDPGELFEWEWLAEKGVGVWPCPTEEEEEHAKDIASRDYDVDKLFVKLGYDPAMAYVDVVSSFHRHYLPMTFGAETQTKVHLKTVAYLLSLIRQYQN
jgi:N-acetylmuramoyl-L-alanine amidase